MACGRLAGESLPTRAISDSAPIPAPPIRPAWISARREMCGLALVCSSSGAASTSAAAVAVTPAAGSGGAAGGLGSPVPGGDGGLLRRWRRAFRLFAARRRGCGRAGTRLGRAGWRLPWVTRRRPSRRVSPRVTWRLRRGCGPSARRASRVRAARGGGRLGRVPRRACRGRVPLFAFPCSAAWPAALARTRRAARCPRAAGGALGGLGSRRVRGRTVIRRRLRLRRGSWPGRGRPEAASGCTPAACAAVSFLGAGRRSRPRALVGLARIGRSAGRSGLRGSDPSQPGSPGDRGARRGGLGGRLRDQIRQAVRRLGLGLGDRGLAPASATPDIDPNPRRTELPVSIRFRHPCQRPGSGRRSRPAVSCSRRWRRAGTARVKKYRPARRTAQMNGYVRKWPVLRAAAAGVSGSAARAARPARARRPQARAAVPSAPGRARGPASGQNVGPPQYLRTNIE